MLNLIILPPNLESSLIIVGTIVLFVVVIGTLTGIIPWYKIKNKFKKMIKNSNELTFYRAYEYFGEYSSEQKNIIENIDVVLSNFRKTDSTTDMVLIESKFHNNYYTFFDLDSDKDLELFKKLYADTPYVIFMSSYDRYWGILDIPYKELNDIFLDTNWKVCNDAKYVSYSKKHNALFIRGLYETEARKPHLFETNGILSDNFQLFIDKLNKYYNKEALELSVLRYKDPTLLVKFSRKRKLQQINNA